MRASKGGRFAIAAECMPTRRAFAQQRDSERKNDILLDHHGGLLAACVMLASLEWTFSWSWDHGRRTKRLELAYRRFLPLVLEIPATFEYIEFEGPPDRLQITKFGGYPTGWGSEAGGRADIISHIMASSGYGAQVMARSAIDSPINRRYPVPTAPFPGSIRPLGPPAQIDVLRSCVFRRKYCQQVTVSLGGYPRGYITEPQQSSFRASHARSFIWRSWRAYLAHSPPAPDSVVIA